MNNENIMQIFIGLFSNPNTFIKIALVLIMLLFLLFTIIFVRQISLLLKLVDQVNFSPIFRFLGYSLVVSTIILLIGVILV